MDRILLKLYLKDSNDNVKFEYNYQFNEEELEKTNARKIGEKYPNINQHETDNIENNEVKFFVWEEEELWGFYVLAILRKEEELYIGQEKFFYFENDKWRETSLMDLNRSLPKSNTLFFRRTYEILAGKF